MGGRGGSVQRWDSAHQLSALSTGAAECGLAQMHGVCGALQPGHRACVLWHGALGLGWVWELGGNGGVGHVLTPCLPVHVYVCTFVCAPLHVHTLPVTSPTVLCGRTLGWGWPLTPVP